MLLIGRSLMPPAARFQERSNTKSSGDRFGRRSFLSVPLQRDGRTPAGGGAFFEKKAPRKSNAGVCLRADAFIACLGRGQGDTVAFFEKRGGRFENSYRKFACLPP